MKRQARYIQISLWNLMFVVVLLYLFLVWIGYKYIERNISQRQKPGQVFHPKIGQDGSFQLYANECPVIHSLHSINVSRFSNNALIKTLNPGVCPIRSKPVKSDIQLEKEWSFISVGYPQYVYTVTGWIQLIDVPNYNAKPLHVIIVPHSHQDLGWKDTYEGYFNSYTKKTIDNIVSQLKAHPTWKFIWSEICNLEKWFSSAESDTSNLKWLIGNGQLEIVTGGWVMNDEAVAHFSSMLDQLIEGHLWLHDNLGIVPNTSWSVDPFGHSPTMTYLLKKAGISRMVIQRAHFAIKRHLAKRQSLEFIWRQAWDSDGKTGTLCHLMPFLLYAIHYSCGPDPHVCCQFDFHSDKCFRGTNTVPRISVDENNIRKLAWALWEQFQKKAQLYQSNILLVPHGDDFRYYENSEWSEQFGNLGKLIDYMNKDADMNIKVEFGTVSKYFDLLQSEARSSKLTFPSFTGDFFPYNDRDDQYWTGFYSSRPLFKYMVRILQAKLRVTEIIYSLTYAQSSEAARDFYSQRVNVLVEVRRALALFQHHDAITGTSKKYVMEDFGKKLQNAIDKIDSLFMLIMVNTLTPKVDRLQDLLPNSVFMSQEWNSYSSVPTLRVSYSYNKWYVIVTNPLTVYWTSPITIRSKIPSVVKTQEGTPVASQNNPVLLSGLQPDIHYYDIVFIADLPPLSMRTYQILEDSSSVVYANVTVLSKELESTTFIPEFSPTRSNKATISLENHIMKAVFSTCKGTLQFIERKKDGRVHTTEIKMLTYGTGSWINPFKDKSGAYIFMPDGHAEELEINYPNVVVLRGPVMSSVIAQLPGIKHSASLYNIQGPMGAGIHIDNIVDLPTKEWENKELVMRVITDVVSPDSSLCVDLNGYQMHRKKYRSKMLIQGNFRPMTSMAFLEDGKSSRMTLVSAEAHGVASLFEGTMEVILDRRLMQDDWRGLNEGPRENIPSPSKFILVPEKRDEPGQPKGHSCYPSVLGHLLANHLNNPPQAAFLPNPSTSLSPSASFLKEPWPCFYNLMNIRNRGAENPTSFNALMVLHRAGVDCKFSQVYMACNMNTTLNLTSFTNLEIVSAVETTLTGVKEIGPLPGLSPKLDDMEIKTIKILFR